MSTSLIIRNPSAPSPRVLEIDGPRFKNYRRDIGAFHLGTSNLPNCASPINFHVPSPSDPRLTDWDSPFWEIYKYHDGSVEVRACRPSEAEIYEGDLHGALGSVIKLAWSNEWAIRNARRLARRLLRADPKEGIVIPHRETVGIAAIESDIPIRVYTHFFDL